MSVSRRTVRRNQHPFPFSAYVVKAYSTENSRQQPSDAAQPRPQAQLNQYLNILEINSKLQREQLPRETLPSNHSAEFQRSEAPAGRPVRSKQPLSPVKKQRVIDNRKIIVSLRYQLVSMMSLLGRREDYVNWLRGKNELLAVALKSNEVQERLEKHLETRGRDKGRVKFNYITSEQLRSLKYKAKTQSVSPSKKQEKERVHYDQDEEGEDEEVEEREEAIDLATWKRRNGIALHTKVFIVKGGYAQLRKGLVERGWVQNQDVWSPYYDFKWTTRICDINFMTLKHSQGVNHFNYNYHLTSKYGLTRRLRTLALSFGVDPDRFYPQCYDLGDQTDFENFVENFKFTFSETVAKRFLVDKARYHGLELKVRIILQITKRRALPFAQTVSNINRGQFPAITPDQWAIITETAKMDPQEQEQRLIDIRKLQRADLAETATPDQENYESCVYEAIDSRIREYLRTLEKRDPQFAINGMRNVWIAKPNFMSRGRGIRCFNNMYDIADYCMGGPTQFVVQKYIQHPLLIEGRKFDIRQWVLIQDFNPPRIWFYEECYLRFSSDQYSLDNIYNRFVHLTNNSIQKYHKQHSPEKSMWDMREFSQWLGEQKWATLQQKMRNAVVWSLKSCEGHVIGKKGSAELVGYDFMVDEQLNPWLIEVNMSPSMDYSTPVTKKLVKMVLQDTAKLLSSPKKGNQVGGFTCIYRGNDDLPRYNLYNI